MVAMRSNVRKFVGDMSEAVRKTIEFLRGRRHAYQQCFKSPAGQMVLMDLARFCRGGETCFNADQRKTDLALGRNEVLLRILNHLNLQTEDLYRLYTGKQITFETPGDDDVLA